MSPSVVVHMLQSHSDLPEVSSSQCFLEGTELLQQGLETAVFKLIGEDVSPALEGDLGVDGEDAGVVETHLLIPLQRDQAHEVVLLLPVARHLPLLRLTLHPQDQLTRLDLPQRHEFYDCGGGASVGAVGGSQMCPGDSAKGCFFTGGYPGGGETVMTTQSAELILEVNAFVVVFELHPQQFLLIWLPALLQAVPPRTDVVKPFQELAA